MIRCDGLCGACDWFETHFDQSSLSVDREEVKVNSTELRAEWLGERVSSTGEYETPFLQQGENKP